MPGREDEGSRTTCRACRCASGGTTVGVTRQEGTAANTVADLTELQTAIGEKEEELERAHHEFGVLDTKLEEQEQRNNEVREAMLQKAELDCYRTKEEERQKWEAREAWHTPDCEGGAAVPQSNHSLYGGQWESEGTVETPL